MILNNYNNNDNDDDVGRDDDVGSEKVQLKGPAVNIRLALQLQQAAKGEEVIREYHLDRGLPCGPAI